jgi:hypothetical protein
MFIDAGSQFQSFLGFSPSIAETRVATGSSVALAGSASVSFTCGSAAITIPSWFASHPYLQISSRLDSPADKSGVSYEPDEDLLYVIRNTNLVRKLQRTGLGYGTDVALGSPFDDTEAICRIAGHSSGREWAVLSEGDFSPWPVMIHLFNLAKDDAAISDLVTYDFTGLITCATGYGAKGLEYDSTTDKFYVGTQLASSGGLWECTIGATPTATQLFTWANSLVAGGACESTAFVSDIRSLKASGRDSWVAIINDAPLASGTTRLAEFTRNGVVLGTLTMPTGQTEGFVFMPTAPYDLYVVGEQTSGANWWKYSTECAIAGSASVAFTCGSAAVTTAVAMVGGAAIAMSCGSAAATTAVALTGTAAVTFTGGSAALDALGTGDLAGATSFEVLCGPSAITASVAIEGSSSATTACGTAQLLVAVPVAGSAVVVFACGTAPITAPVALTGSAAIVFASSTSPVVVSALIVGDAVIVFACATAGIDPGDAAAISGTASISVICASSAILATVALIGSAVIAFTCVESSSGSARRSRRSF